MDDRKRLLADIVIACKRGIDACNVEKDSERTEEKKEFKGHVKEMNGENFRDMFSHKIVHEALGTAEVTNVQRIADSCNTSYTGLWYALKGRRKWNAEVWLRTLASLGALEIDGDKMIINTSFAGDLIQSIERNRCRKA